MTLAEMLQLARRQSDERLLRFKRASKMEIWQIDSWGNLRPENRAGGYAAISANDVLAEDWLIVEPLQRSSDETHRLCDAK